MVGVLFHESALNHESGPSHPERADRIVAVRRALQTDGRLAWHEARPATREQVAAVHSEELLVLLESLDAQGGGRLDPDTRMGASSLEAAFRACGAAVEAAGRVLSGEWRAGFVCMRPPGHHATRDRAMGFCLLNQAAVAARWAVRNGAASRVAIVDWDAHHGNGTQDIFWTDPDVLYASLHQYPWYPGTGDATETGAGDADGTTLNVPLPAGSGEDAYRRAFDEIVLPAVRAFDPGLVVVSAGYDAHRADPLCLMQLNAGSFFRFAGDLLALGRPAVFVLEGGYDTGALASSSAATCAAALGDDTLSGLDPAELEARTGDPEAHRWVDRALRVLPWA